MSEQRRRLIEAMVGDEYRDLYLHEAWFKMSVDQVAMFVVPALVRGLAIEGAEKHWERERLIEAVMRSPMVRGVSDG